MNVLIRRVLWAALWVAVLACLLLEAWPRAGPTSRLTRLPERGLGYVGRDVPLNEAEATVFQRASVVKRLYQVGESRFVMLAVDGGGDRHAIHDPLYCFRGAGWTVTRESSRIVPGGRTRIVRLAKGRQSAEAMYWITDGAHRHSSALRARWQSLVVRFESSRTNRAPVLVLLQPVAGSTVDWDEVLKGFPELLTI